MIQKGEMVNVKVRIQGNKIDWFPATVIAFGMYIHEYTHCIKIFMYIFRACTRNILGDKKDMESLQDEFESGDESGAEPSQGGCIS